MTTEIIRKPTVVLVGRTNVGKSTLFNRLIEEAKALISPIAGTTRSPNYGQAIWRGAIIEIVDTGGLERRSEDPFAEGIRQHAWDAICDSDVILFLIDLRIGVTPRDRELAKILLPLRDRVLLVGNKADQHEARRRAIEPTWRGLGLGELHTISAATGMGVGDLLDNTFAMLKRQGITPPLVEDALYPIRVAIIGKPNVGKSALLNKLVGSDRALVSEIAHTTREPQDTLVRVGEQLFLFIDTAGVRKHMKIAPGLEAAGVRKTLNVLERTDVALFVIDLVQGVGNQDQHLAGIIDVAHKGMIVVANKWDTVPDKKTNTQNDVREALVPMIPGIAWAPMVFTSAKTGEHVARLFNVIMEAYKNSNRIIPEDELDRFFRETTRLHRPSRGKGVKHPRIYGMKQIGSAPPTFVLSVQGRRDSVHASYLRYLEHQLREHFDFTGTAIHIQARSIRPHS